ncbi:MAG TPA: hypothetical protein VJN18_08730 [Polyangiaceae bacterium]|nr:hypothetical protein [Polyangiaceae bacterium]
MKRRSRSLSHNHHSWLALLTLPALACSPVTFREAYPKPLLRSKQEPVSAELHWISYGPGVVRIGIGVKGAAKARLERAALTQTGEPYGQCHPEAACDPLDSRFTTGTTADIQGSEPRYGLAFPFFGADRELHGSPQLLLDVATPAGHRLIELDLTRTTFVSGNWGLGGAIRYRPPRFVARRVGHALSAELAAERWLGWTRLRLGYEIGWACCDVLARIERAQEDREVLIPVGGQLSAVHYVRLSRAFTLGIGLGYEVLVPLPSEELPPGIPALLHGPRFTLQLARTTPRLPHFVDEPPKAAVAPELALELLFEDRFSAPRVVPSLGWAYWISF